jgi:hypothetical protein
MADLMCLKANTTPYLYEWFPKGSIGWNLELDGWTL